MRQAGTKLLPPQCKPMTIEMIIEKSKNKFNNFIYKDNVIICNIHNKQINSMNHLHHRFGGCSVCSDMFHKQKSEKSRGQITNPQKCSTTKQRGKEAR